MFTQIQKDFLSSFSWEIEISNLKEIVEPNEKENIYFLAWISKKDKRNNDHDILVKNYFFLDFDIRNYFRDSEQSEITDDEIIKIWEDLARFLNQNPKYGFNQWRYIVYTGNWIHLYYVWDPLEVWKDISVKEYSFWISVIYNAFKEYIGSPYLSPDIACKNIGRIARLPDTINQKNGKRVIILAEQNVKSILVSKIPQYWKKQSKLQEEYQMLLAKKYALLAREELMNWKDRSFMEKILAYPVESLLMESGKIEISDFVRNKNFIDPRDKSYYWFYKAQDGNYIVVWWSTTLSPYADWHDWLNPFHLVQGLYWLDNAWVFNFFQKKLWATN